MHKKCLLCLFDYLNWVNKIYQKGIVENQNAKTTILKIQKLIFCEFLYM